LATLAEVNDAKGESDGHPIIGHYVIGAVVLKPVNDRMPNIGL
jgi:hypothetical protein